MIKMKKHFLTLILAAMTLIGCNSNNGLYGLLSDFDNRITTLEILCQEFNTNITSLRTIVEAQQTGDYITGITPIMKDGKQVGYTITFAKHEPITIYNGEDGAKGDKGDKGETGDIGTLPIVGVAQDTDGKYYWTLNGEWLLDDAGQKIPVTGEKGDKGETGAAGQDGQNGTNGTNGQDGQDGQDGVTPQLKIENDYWYISYDKGATWTQLGKAKGDKGDTGATGMTGQDGNTVFTAVEYDENFVYFTLVDGQIIKISRFSSNNEVNELIVDGAIMYEFSVSPTQKVYFSQGNLQYNAALGNHVCADGTTKPGTWRFAEHQYDVMNFNCANASATYSGWQDLFAYGTSGYNNYYPYLFDIYCDGDYHYTAYREEDISGTYYDWGGYNAISNGGNRVGVWRTLTKEEVDYLLSGRTNAELLSFKAIVHGIKGTVFLPDNWSTLLFPNFSTFNSFVDRQWESVESVGAVFLPVAGTYAPDYGRPGYPYMVRSDGAKYWVGTHGGYYSYNTAYTFAYIKAYGDNTDGSYEYLCSGCSVRLVKNVE